MIPRMSLQKRRDALARLQDIVADLLMSDLRPDELEPDVSLFADGLGLDSIDAVELVVAVEKEFGVRVAEEGGDTRALRSLNTLLDAIEGHAVAMDTTGEPPRIRHGVGVCALPEVEILELRGAQAWAHIEAALPVRLGLRDGDACETLLLDAHDKAVARVRILCTDERFLLLSEGASLLPALLAVGAVPEHAPLAVLAVDGPFAWELLDARDVPLFGLRVTGDEICVQCPQTGEYGYLLLLPESAAPTRLAGLTSAAEDLGGGAVSRDERDNATLQSFRFVPRWMGGLLPEELQLSWAVEGGRPPARRRIVGFRCDRAVPSGAVLALDGVDVGTVQVIQPFAWDEGFFGVALLPVEVAHPGLRLVAGEAELRTVSAPMVRPRSRGVNRHAHSWATQDQVPPAAVLVE
jgi:acyl carrier protein